QEKQRCEKIDCLNDNLRCNGMPFTKCRSGSCQCQDDYYLDYSSQQCKFSYISSLQMIERSVPIVVVMVALVLLSSAIGRCYYLRRQGPTPSDELRIESSNNLFTFYDQVVVSDTRNYPPPPPYTLEYEPKNSQNSAECSHFSSPPPPYSL